MFTPERIDGSGPITGYYFHQQDGDIDAHFIINPRGSQFEVHGDTVVQVELLPRPTK